MTFPGPQQDLVEAGRRVEQRDQSRHTPNERSNFTPRPTSWHNSGPASDALPSVARYLQPLQQHTSSSAPAGSSSGEQQQQQCTLFEEELSGRFPSMFRRRQMPSTPGSGNYDETTRTARSQSVLTMPSEGGRGCRVSTRYTPYSYQPCRACAPSRISRPSPSRLRSESPRLFLRNVFLIDAGENKVPRGPFRQDLYDKGCVVDFFEFNSSWSEERVVEELERAFDNILPVGTPSPR